MSEQLRPLKLCFVGPAASVTTRRWVDWFARRGHQTTLMTVEPSAGEERTVGEINLAEGKGPRKLARLHSAVRLSLAIRRLRPDVVHVHYARGLAWGLLLRRPHPCVVTPWGSDVLADQGAFREWYSRPLTKRLLGSADLITVHSTFMEAQVRPLLRTAVPLARVGWGVDLTRFRPCLDTTRVRTYAGVKDGQPVIFSPRLAQPFYRHERVIRALPAIREKAGEAILVIPRQSEDAGYVRKLRRLADELNVADGVRFVPPIPYGDMPLWMNMAHAVVMIPPSDGMPNTLWEAMACGVPPVLNRLPQYAGVVRHGINGMLVDQDGDLAGSVAGLLTDPVLRAVIAERNLALVREQGDQQREMARMEEWYRLLTAGGRSRSGDRD